MSKHPGKLVVYISIIKIKKFLTPMQHARCDLFHWVVELRRSVSLNQQSSLQFTDFPSLCAYTQSQVWQSDWLTFSFSGAVLLLVSTKNRDLWETQIFGACSENSFRILSQSDCRTWLWACAEWREVRESRTSGVGPSYPFAQHQESASEDENGQFPEWLILFVIVAKR